LSAFGGYARKRYAQEHFQEAREAVFRQEMRENKRIERFHASVQDGGASAIEAASIADAS
jgi:hypothetical protein